MTRAAFDVVSAFGSLNAVALPGSVISAVLVDRGWTASNVRNQITRLMERQLLVREAAGRHSVYSLAEPLLRRFQTLGGALEAPSYDGYFHALFYSIPEADRATRDRLLYIASHEGFALLRPGVLIGLHDADTIARRTGAVDAGGWLFTGRLTPSSLEEARAMTAIAFQHGDASRRISRLQKEVAAMTSDPSVSLNQHFEVYFEVSRELFRIPHLPAELFTGPRPATELHALAQRLNAMYFERHYDHVSAIAHSTKGAELIETVPWEIEAQPPVT